MYTQVWDKYLPIIRILLKRSQASDQLLEMNLTDFEKAAVGRRDSYNFSIHFRNGRPDNPITSKVAKDLSEILLKDDTVKDLFTRNGYDFQMNKKFQLNIRQVAKAPVQEA
ncbi:MAG: hypothetical protein ACJ75B_10540 [Flavisolibacter sp.]|jgi:hypothetical protein